MKQSAHTICIAPMMDYTDRHDRYFLRLIAPHVFLYTEMITANALIHGDYKRLLAFDALEHPVALQLGGSEPDKLAQAARLGEDFGYDEMNLNVGCPSDRVKSGRFGACLMLEPAQVGDCVLAMKQAVKIPVTVKCRIGVDDHDSYEALTHFIRLVSEAGCDVFIIHARKAWLNGLSPKQNRDIPPLQYETVHAIKRDFPHLTIVINGGIKQTAEIEAQLNHVDGVMIGREAYSNPWWLASIESRIFSFEGSEMNPRERVIEKMLPYIENQLKNNVKLSSMTRHILGLYQGQKGARMWRRYLSEQAHRPNAGIEIINEALAHARSIV
ncbi:MAG TPA: tRNA dihydrouridine(20/20a) synthase DusA [Gammaproteobacteria bacterium]|nr:tRNA dihydrouridine(20/20a) synthase DusA [Gammaproteobacteria bacterium]